MSSLGEPQRTPCTCGGSPTGLCNLSDCRQPWAVEYGRYVRIRWWERVVGFFAAFVIWWPRSR